MIVELKWVWYKVAARGQEAISSAERFPKTAASFRPLLLRRRPFDGVVISQSMGIKRESKSSASATSPCADLRAAYHNCFNRWYSEKFVKGQWDEEPCVSEWQKYRACLSEHLEDKKLKRFLEEETLVHSSMKADAS